MREELLTEIRDYVISEFGHKAPWLSANEVVEAVNNFEDWSLGFGPFTEIIAEGNFNDLFINGDNGSWIKRGAVMEKIPDLAPEPALINFLRALALRAGKHFDLAHPAIDLELSHGARIHALLPPIVEGGLHLSLRINQERHQEYFHGASGEILQILISGKVNFLISGGTGSGKTTMLAEMIRKVPPSERILVIEDTHEISTDHPHLLRLQSREVNSEGKGSYPLRELIRQALRMRPDRIFLGEVRSSDVLDLFLALNTGHNGSAATIHGNSAADIPNRIAALAMLAGLPRAGALALFSSAISVLIHLDSREVGNRISSISRLHNMGDTVEITPIISSSGADFSHCDVEKIKRSLRM